MKYCKESNLDLDVNAKFGIYEFKDDGNVVLHKEKFLPIKNYENLYEISNCGRVKSLKRKIKNSRGNGYKTIGEKILKQIFVGHNYLAVNLSKNGKVKKQRIHILVGKHFKSNPNNLPELDHIFNDKSSNHQFAIEWVTHQENILRSFRRDGRKPSKPPIPRTGKNAIRGIVQFTKNDKFIAEFESMHKAEKELKINHGNICSCCKGNKKLAGGFIFKYASEINNQSKNKPASLW